MIKDVSGFLDSKGKFHKTLKEAQEQEAEYLIEEFYHNLPFVSNHRPTHIHHFIANKEAWDKLYDDYQTMLPNIKMEERKNSWKQW